MPKHLYKSDLSTDEKVMMVMVRTAETLKRTHSGVSRKYGISFPQYNVLRALSASEEGQKMISDVSRIMHVPAANITGIARPTGEGWIHHQEIRSR